MLSALSLALSILYRIHIKLKVYPNDTTGQTLVGDVLSTIFNSIVIKFLNYVRFRLLFNLAFFLFKIVNLKIDLSIYCFKTNNLGKPQN